MVLVEAMVLIAFVSSIAQTIDIEQNNKSLKDMNTYCKLVYISIKTVPICSNDTFHFKQEDNCEIITIIFSDLTYILSIIQAPRLSSTTTILEFVASRHTTNSTFYSRSSMDYFLGKC
ncbi:unnamed protein product [Trifolium pratense]|uniref:Uncharacterized protein n=1 Tax=Trifolium pratense TaxID=57577 RepID=A0ACB0IT28_TRIPR|nr:unnamed protein product [Trifolium pratense]